MEHYSDNLIDNRTNCELYFDSAANTRILPEVLDAMEPFLREKYGNSSSIYTLGIDSKEAIEHAREIVAAAINASPDEIYFTSGGTESNNWIIKGLRNKFKYHSMHIITSAFEHASILNAIKDRRLLYNDTDYTLVSVTRNGIVMSESVAYAIGRYTTLVSIMDVNNELGTVQPISYIGNICEDKGILFHVDAVQSFGHMPIDVKKMHISALSLSAHKLGGPMGIGALYVSRDYKSQLSPLISGGHQESGMRAGTENVAAIVGLGKATEIAMRDMRSNYLISEHLTAMILDNLIDKVEGVSFNVPYYLTDARHINLQIDGVRSEELMALLDSQGVCISAGSACNSRSGQPSHVLKAIGLTDEQIGSSIRISLDGSQTAEEMLQLISYLKEDINILRQTRGTI